MVVEILKLLGDTVVRLEDMWVSRLTQLLKIVLIVFISFENLTLFDRCTILNIKCIAKDSVSFIL